MDQPKGNSTQLKAPAPTLVVEPPQDPSPTASLLGLNNLSDPSSRSKSPAFLGDSRRSSSSFRYIERLSVSLGAGKSLKVPTENSCARSRKSFSGVVGYRSEEIIDAWPRRYSDMDPRRVQQQQAINSTYNSANRPNFLVVPENFRRLSCSNADIDDFLAQMSVGNANPILDKIGKVSRRVAAV